jgi:hypothetical protein
MDRKMGQRANQVVLEKSSGALMNNQNPNMKEKFLWNP